MTTFLSDIILSNANDIQFQTTAGTNAGKISQVGDDLVLSNAVGDILLGNGSDDIFIGDGTNTVDIRFEQNMAIFADSSSTRTLTLGGNNTNLVLESPTLNSATFGATTVNNTLTFTTANGFIVFDYEPPGDTNEYTSEVPLLKVDKNGTPRTILSRVSENGAIMIGHDDTVALTAGDTRSTVKSNWGMTNEHVVFAAEGGYYAWGWPNNMQNDSSTQHGVDFSGWSNRYEFRFRTDAYSVGNSTTETTNYSKANNGLYIGSGGSTQFIDMDRNLKNIGTINSGVITTTGFTLDGNTITGVDNSGEFTNNDAHIMTSAAVEDKILGYGYYVPGGTLSAGTINFTGELNFTGNGAKYIDVFTLANSNDFTIRHHNETGNLFENAFRSTANGATYLYHNGNTKLTTKSDGVDITGELQCDTLDVEGNGEADRMTLNGTSFPQLFLINGSGNDQTLQLGVAGGSAYFKKSDATGQVLFRNSNNTNLMTIGMGDGGQVTVLNELEAGSLDINGAADISGDLTLSGGALIGDSNWDIYAEYTNRGRINLLSNNSADTNVQVALLTNGNQRLTIDKAGTVSILGDLTVGGQGIVSQGSPTLILKDTGDNDDHGIIFRDESDNNDYKITTQDFTSAGAGQGLFMGSDAISTKVCLVTNDTIALTLDTSQNATFAGNITLSSNSNVVSARKFTARDANGVMLTADDASSGLTIADNGNATFSGELNVAGDTTITNGLHVHHDEGIEIGDTGNNSTARTTLTSFNSGGNSRMKIKGGNFVHSLRLETSKNDFQYADFNSSYNGSDTTLNLNKSNSDTTGTDATTTISTGTSTFAGNVTVGSNSLTAGSLDINGNADISGNLTGVDNLTINGTLTGVSTATFAGDVQLLTSTGEYSLYGAANGQTALYTNGIKKFETTTVGIDVTGEVQADSLDIDGNSQLDGTLTVGVDDTGYDVKFYGATTSRFLHWDESEDYLLLRDNVKGVFGNSADLKLYHDSNNSYIENNGGNLYIMQRTDGGDMSFQCDAGDGTDTEYFRLDGGDVKTIFSKPIEVTGNLDVNGVVELANSASALTLNNSTYSELRYGTSCFFRANGAQNILDSPLNIIKVSGTEKARVNSTGLSVTGDIAVTGTVDGVDIATRDGVLTSTTTTANAALPKTGGTMTGAITLPASNPTNANHATRKAYVDAQVLARKESFILACSDETTDLTASSSNPKVTFRMPYAFTLTDVRATVNEAPVGSTIIVDVKKAGTSIFSTKVSIDVNSKSSFEATTPKAFAAAASEVSFNEDQEVTVFLDQIGSSTAGQGLKVMLIGNQ